ncbi:toxin-antitoxin system YwqK family antitoxin [Dyadobacter helix]|uniref:toxin-antitoxin system YwqK family antitoxin n=1 Tax=Dyadobacter helix TaxID=2822344 RepID=UPI001BFC6E68|nr:hypothetical protein [Dyadobacter sp. CECT 9275]
MSGDTLILKKYLSNGKIKEEEYFLGDNKLYGRYWKYLKNTFYGYEISKVKNSKTELTAATFFYPEGQIRAKFATIGGKAEGKYTSYYTNGQIEIECNYTRGKADGTFLWFFENSQLWTERIYERGRLVQVVENFNMYGKPMNKGDFSNGTGALYEYDYQGNLVDIQHYVNGIHKYSEVKRQKRRREFWVD